MRVLIPSVRSTSGIDTHAKSLAVEIAGAGHEAVVVDERGDYQPPHPSIARAELPEPRRLPGGLGPFAEWGRQREVRRLAAEHEVDGIHAARPGLIPRGVPATMTVWDPVPGPLARSRIAPGRGEDPMTEAAYAITDRLAVRRVGAIVAPTEAVQRGYESLVRSELIPPFLPDERVREPAAERGSEVVMVAGQLDHERKGLDLALAAMAELRERRDDARLVLVGNWMDPSRPDSLPEFCEARGRLTPDELHATFSAAGCCLIPSLWEEFGLSGLEALAAGAPVACAPLPGYEGLAGGGVFRAESRDPIDLAAQIEAALEVRSFEFPAECRASIAVPRLLALYEEIF
jgi:glycosyltransferase involved in cell wall biosynthesis